MFLSIILCWEDSCGNVRIACKSVRSSVIARFNFLFNLFKVSSQTKIDHYLRQAFHQQYRDNKTLIKRSLHYQKTLLQNWKES